MSSLTKKDGQRNEFTLKKDPKGGLGGQIIDFVLAFVAGVVAHFFVKLNAPVAVVFLVFLFALYGLRVQRRLQVLESYVEMLLRRE